MYILFTRCPTHFRSNMDLLRILLATYQHHQHYRLHHHHPCHIPLHRRTHGHPADIWSSGPHLALSSHHVQWSQQSNLPQNDLLNLAGLLHELVLLNLTKPDSTTDGFTFLHAGDECECRSRLTPQNAATISISKLFRSSSTTTSFDTTTVQSCRPTSSSLIPAIPTALISPIADSTSSHHRRSRSRSRRHHRSRPQTSSRRRTQHHPHTFTISAPISSPTSLPTLPSPPRSRKDTSPQSLTSSRTNCAHSGSSLLQTHYRP